ncbi:hypothetical protein [Bacillus thuringiensis]|uniref:hypothetical protein n=1 Tax=Bacillus thuringiensis TaxID=1428 RepID=UPI000B448259|nr:hypothetical protein [Bacillus thuringiensis]MCU4957517.1 hypothetical protein [Bacillus cereus]MED3180879.1 hypothetical protein [Bacillus thuringiensis]OTX99648.1 hypothetical protein BK734_31260 [Bacillus thuringiensis serovar kim]OUB12786.1 hypothetical protein BK733_30990 [Bacillus thuringiensis serovar xiaguangiensis]
MQLPNHIELNKVNEKEYILVNTVSCRSIKIGENELNFLIYLYEKNQKNDSTSKSFNLKKSQQEFLEKKFNELGFLSEEVSKGIQEKKKSKDFSKITLMRFNPEVMLNKIAPINKYIFSRGTVMAMVFVNMLAFMLLGINREEWLNNISLENLNISKSILLYLMILITLMIHELAHGVSCYFFGGRVKEMGVMLFYFSVALYCDVSSTYLFKNQAEKVIVILSGLIIQLMLGSLAIILYAIFSLFSYNLDVLLFFSVINLGIIILNLIPLIKLDGYWLLSQLVDITNLRDKSFQFCLSTLLPQYKTLNASHLPKERNIFKLYGITALIFTIFLWGSAISSFYNMIKKYNELASLIFLCILILIMIIHVITTWNRYIRSMKEQLSLKNSRLE